MAACPACGGEFPATDGPTHRYMESSPGCWACYGEVLAREYGDYRYAKVHRLTVDAYALQHPGRPSPQTIQSVNLHLISLCAIFDEGMEPHRATKVLQAAARHKDRFEWLPPPASPGPVTVADVHGAEDPEEHARRAWQWARAVWQAWEEHHPVARRWLAHVTSHPNG